MCMQYECTNDEITNKIYEIVGNIDRNRSKNNHYHSV